MLECRLGGIHCRFSLLFPALLSVLLLLHPDGTALLCVLASVAHECGHLAVMLAVGTPPERCTLGGFGMRLEIGKKQAGYAAGVAIALAGPLVNAACAWLFWRLRQSAVAAIHLLLCWMNLLPISGLDGGEALCHLVACFTGPLWGARVLRVTSVVGLAVLLGMALWLLARQGNPTLLTVAGYLLMAYCLHEKAG